MTEPGASNARLACRLGYVNLALGGAIVASTLFLHQVWLVAVGASLITVGVSSLTVARTVQDGRGGEHLRRRNG